MATTKRARKSSVEKTAVASNLLEALRFISVAQQTDGTPMQMHCRISGQTVVGFNGGLTAGHFIDEDLNVCPHTATLILALSKCKEAISITETEAGKLSIKSGKFRALVPCMPFSDLQAVEPDPPIATINDSLKIALGACVVLAQDTADAAFLCGVLLQAETAVATNRHVVIEAWHGVDLPPMLIPKSSVNAIIKNDKVLKSFGYSGNSATFFYEDNSFIKTQLFQDKFPDYRKVLDIESNPWPLPSGFYEALEIVAPFTENDRVYFIDGKMSSNKNLNLATTYDVEGLKDGLAFNVQYLKLIRPFVHSIHFDVTSNGLSVFFGNNVRGGIMRIGVNG